MATLVLNNTRPTINSGSTTPRGLKKGHHYYTSHSDVSIESPYFSPSKERPPGSKNKNYVIVERQSLTTTTKLDKSYSMDQQKYALESSDPF